MEQGTRVRPGLWEMFGWLKAHDVPLVVVSAGLVQVIGLVLAREDCALRSGHLLMFVDEGEMAALVGGGDNWSPMVGEYWLGIHDSNVEGAPECDSPTGGCESEFTAWDTTGMEPTENDASKNCVYLKTSEDGSTATWLFGSCSTPRRYVCEQTNARGGAGI